MPLLGFQKQFAPLVESGEKTQTIRAYRKDGNDPRPGDTLYLYTGLRTKQCRKLGEVICTSVEPITIFDSGEARIKYTGSRSLQWKYRPCLVFHQIAVADGFGCYAEMLAWFKKTHGLPFEGLLIKWGEIQLARSSGPTQPGTPRRA